MVLGIDVGGSTTKIVGLDAHGEFIGMLQVEAGDQITSAFGAFGKFMAQFGMKMCEVDQIVLTGVGASYLESGMYDVPTKRIDEFMAIGLGGLKLAELEEALIVSVGTGTAIVKASSGNISHLGGSGVGGGMLLNLAGRFAGVHSFKGIREIAKRGDLGAVDLRLSDFSTEQIGNLPPEATVSNFGNLRDDAAPADIVLGLINAIFESIGMMAIFASQGSGVKDIVLIGSLSATAHARVVFETLAKIHPVRFHIPKQAIYGTALGAALSEFG